MSMRYEPLKGHIKHIFSKSLLQFSSPYYPLFVSSTSNLLPYELLPAYLQAVRPNFILNQYH